MYSTELKAKRVADGRMRVNFVQCKQRTYKDVVSTTSCYITSLSSRWDYRIVFGTSLTETSVLRPANIYDFFLENYETLTQTGHSVLPSKSYINSLLINIPFNALQSQLLKVSFNKKED